MKENKQIISQKIKSNQTSNEIKGIIKIRAKLVDWMVIVAKILDLKDATFFLTFEILDKYLTLIQFNFREEQMHLLAIACLFIANKLEEVKTLQVETLVKNVAHGKHTKEEIIKMEYDVLSVLKFKIPENNFNDFISVLISQNFPNEDNHRCLFNEYVYEKCKRIYKVLLMDYFYIRSTSLPLIYNSIFLFSVDSFSRDINYNHFFLQDVYVKNLETYEITSDMVIQQMNNILLRLRKFLSDAENFQYLSAEMF